MQKDQGDPLGMIAFERSELAIAVIASMCGRNIRQILREKSKSDPDPDVLKELHEKGSLYRKEKEAVYRGNIEVQKRVIRDYAPILKNENK